MVFYLTCVCAPSWLYQVKFPLHNTKKYMLHIPHKQTAIILTKTRLLCVIWYININNEYSRGKATASQPNAISPPQPSLHTPLTPSRFSAKQQYHPLDDILQTSPTWWWDDRITTPTWHPIQAPAHPAANPWTVSYYSHPALPAISGPIVTNHSTVSLYGSL